MIARRPGIAGAMILALCGLLGAQEDMPPAGGRGGRGNTREFLGLGAAPDSTAPGVEVLSKGWECDGQPGSGSWVSRSRAAVT